MAVFLCLAAVSGLLCFQRIAAVRPCVKGMAHQVEENSQDYQQLSCDKIDRTESITWEIALSSGHKYDSTCHPRPYRCSSNILMEAVRPSDTKSHLLIRNVTRNLGGANVSCYTHTTGTETGSSNCLIDVVYGASMTSCFLQFPGNSTFSSLRIACKIGKVFSSLGRYSCQFLRQGEGSDTQALRSATMQLPVSRDDQDPAYAEGTCSYNGSLPHKAGTYSYRVVIQPGQKTVDAGSISMPAAPPDLSCKFSSESEMLTEDMDLQCVCTASDLGRPQGRLFVYHGNSLLSQGDNRVEATLSNLNRADNGTTVRCILQAAWGPAEQRNQSDKFLVLVGYGPDTVTLTGPAMINISPTVPVAVTVSCDYTQAWPGVIFSWNEPCSLYHVKVCTFYPSLSQDGDIVSCTVTNIATRKRKSAYWTLRVAFHNTSTVPSPADTTSPDGPGSHTAPSTRLNDEQTIQTSVQNQTIITENHLESTSSTTDGDLGSSVSLYGEPSTPLRFGPHDPHSETTGTGTTVGFYTSSAGTVTEHATSAARPVKISQAGTQPPKTVDVTVTELGTFSPRISAVHSSTPISGSLMLGSANSNSVSDVAPPYLVIGVIVSLGVSFVIIALLLSILIILCRRRRSRRDTSSSGRPSEMQTGSSGNNTSGGPYDEIRLDSVSASDGAVPGALNVFVGRSENTRVKIVATTTDDDGYLTPRPHIRSRDEYLTPCRSADCVKTSAPKPCTFGKPPAGYLSPCRSGQALPSGCPLNNNNNNNNNNKGHRRDYLTPCYQDETPPPYEPRNPVNPLSDNSPQPDGCISMSPTFNVNISTLSTHSHAAERNPSNAYCVLPLEYDQDSHC